MKNLKDSKIVKFGNVIWITGLSGSGKSTLAKELVLELGKQNKSVLSIDGDDLRKVFGSTSNYDRSNRLILAKKYSALCGLISKQGFDVVISTISLFKEIHNWNRINLPHYFEIYLKVPINELRKRDPKGIYKKFDAGLLKNVAGLDLPIDEPEKPDWIEEFHPNRSTSSIAKELIKYLSSRRPK